MELLNHPTDLSRERGDLPSLPIINMFAEEYLPEGRVILQSRPGLTEIIDFGTSPVRHIYSEPGVFDGDFFYLVGGTLYRGTNSLGLIVGDGPVSVDSYKTRLFLTAGSGLYTYNGTTLTTIALPGAAASRKLLVAASRVLTIADDSQTIYWSEPLDATIDSLAFAEAENSPDDLLDMLFIGDSLILFGEGTTEFWTLSADPDLPFVPVQGRVYSKGIKATGAATKIGSTFAWITNNNQVCIETPDNIVSNRDLELDVADSEALSLWTFYLDNTEFLVVSTDNNTWVMSVATRLWSRFKSYSADTWEADCYCEGVFGSKETGRILEWSSDYTDDEDEILERRFRVYAPLGTKTEIIHNLILKTNPGQTADLTGDYVPPIVSMRSSKDGGFTWGAWRDASMGQQGKYRTLVRWLANGLFSMPGAMFEFRMTDPAPFRVTSVLANEPFGGF